LICQNSILGAFVFNLKNDKNMNTANANGTRFSSFEERTETGRFSARDSSNEINAPCGANIEDNELPDREVCNKIGPMKELYNNLKDVIENLFLVPCSISMLLYSVLKIVAIYTTKLLDMKAWQFLIIMLLLIVAAKLLDKADFHVIEMVKKFVKNS
jgi:hypothetical protein